ncbi:hypothetical protein CXB51_027299 [Gossypium anomalum]|uniref:Uncharacterized protein n=1 Tax=Gossypium anomalum TaxID=47600 RepID=A0A8J5YTR7_9ROSI|nr:hypothetical protein CXB51_027299 [Gossypium anomalum]
MKSMSLTSSFPLHVPVTASTSLVKHVNKIAMLKHNQVPNNKKPTFQIRSFSKKNKVNDYLFFCFTFLCLVFQDITGKNLVFHVYRCLNVCLIWFKQVFEDQSQGLICYEDENGEIVCEGYDEGPRFHQRTFYHLR